MRHPPAYARVPGALLFALAASRGVAQSGSSASPPSPGVEIAGTVFDSLAMRPLANALVQLAAVPQAGRVGVMRSAHTDSAGRFRFLDVDRGTFLLGFQHLALDSLGLHAPVHRIDVRRATGVRATLAIPSMATMLARSCGPSAGRDSASLLVGSVRHARSDQSLAKAFVTVRWSEIILSRGGMRRDLPVSDIFTNEEGWFAACIPGGIPVQVQAAHERAVSGSLELQMPAQVILRHDLYVGNATQVIVGDSVRRETGTVATGERIVSRGPGVLRGVVRKQNGLPLASARVALANGAGAVEARSDSAGRFVLTALPQGTYAVEARALGYLPDQQIVDIVEFREPEAAFLLLDLRTVLDTMRIAAVRRIEDVGRAGFERRRRMGVGTFIDEGRIDSLRPERFSDLLRGVPGVRFVRGSSLDDVWDEWIEIGGTRSAAPCTPTIFLDGGMLLAGRTDLDQMLNVRTVRRVEVYPSSVTPPAEYSGRAACGILALWTERRSVPRSTARQ